VWPPIINTAVTLLFCFIRKLHQNVIFKPRVSCKRFDQHGTARAHEKHDEIRDSAQALSHAWQEGFAATPSAPSTMNFGAVRH
jgi:hypothetical protein